VGVPSSQALPGYLVTAPPSVCVPDVFVVLSVWIQKQNKKTGKWAWDIPDGVHRPIREYRNLCFHTGLVRTTIGSLLEPAVMEIKDWSMVPALRPVLCPFC